MSEKSESNEDVATDSRGHLISSEVANELQEAASRTRAAVVARRVWERLFSEEEQQQLGGDFDACWTQFGTAGMWMESRGVSVEQAVIDIGEGVNLMDSATASWLRRELDLEDVAAIPDSARPEWNPDRGKLTLGGQVIRRLRVMRKPSKIQTILDEFQSTGWPSRIDNPLTLGQQQLHEALRSLNHGLRGIRFRGQEGGEAVCWEII